MSTQTPPRSPLEQVFHGLAEIAGFVAAASAAVFDLVTGRWDGPARRRRPPETGDEAAPKAPPAED